MKQKYVGVKVTFGIPLPDNYTQNEAIKRIYNDLESLELNGIISGLRITEKV